MKAKVNEALKAHFRPEFLNRIDEVIVFHELSRAEVVEIVDLMIARAREQLETRASASSSRPAAKELLADSGYDPQLGARPLRRAIQQLVEDPLSERILWKEFRVGETIIVDVEDVAIVFKSVEASPRRPSSSPRRARLLTYGGPHLPAGPGGSSPAPQPGVRPAALVVVVLTPRARRPMARHRAGVPGPVDLCQVVAAGRGGTVSGISPGPVFTAGEFLSRREESRVFDIGDKVVYPHHGAAVVERRETKEAFGKKQEYLVLRLAYGDLTLMVPADNTEGVGLREVINDEEVEEVFAVLRKKEARMPTNWSRRYKNHSEKLRSGDIYQVAEVVRNLSIRDKDKGLSAGEKRMLSRARQILVSELTFALGVDEETAEVRLNDALP